MGARTRHMSTEADASEWWNRYSADELQRMYEWKLESLEDSNFHNPHHELDNQPTRAAERSAVPSEPSLGKLIIDDAPRLSQRRLGGAPTYASTATKLPLGRARRTCTISADLAHYVDARTGLPVKDASVAKRARIKPPVWVRAGNVSYFDALRYAETQDRMNVKFKKTKT